MANELKVGYRSGLVLYALVQSEGGLYWNATTQALEVFSGAHWSNYKILLTEEGTSGDYFGDFPTLLPKGVYRWEARLQTGAGPVQADPFLGDVDPFNWNPGVGIPGVYTSPTVDQIINRSGINTRMERYVQGDLVTSLTELIPDAEARTALAVSEAFFVSGDLTAFQATALQIAVSKRVIADFLRRVCVQWASGTQAPRERINPEELETLAERFEEEAERYDRLAMGTGSDEGTQEGILPFLIAEGVDPNGLNLTPAGKLELLDERSNIPVGRRFAW